MRNPAVDGHFKVEMTREVAVPLWLALATGLLAAWALLTLILVPGLRWFVRRRVQRVVEQVATRWKIELPRFKLTRRRVLIDRVFEDPKVQAAAAAHAAESGEPLPLVWSRVRRCAEEIVPSFNAYLYYRIGYAAARAVARALYRVRVGRVDEEPFACIDRGATVVFVMNHRSNMDYVLVAFLAAERATLSFAVGEWARIWPLQQLIRAMGAFFVRRNSGDALYRAVLSRYVQMATAGGVTQALFPEGGLSIDGRLREPRFGLLAYLLDGMTEGSRDLVFIPVGLNYDRVIEDRSQLRKLHPELPRRRRRDAIAIALRFLVRQLVRVAARSWHRFGYACVNFGRPLSMREWQSRRGLAFAALHGEARRDAIAALGRELMAAIAEQMPVLPVSLVASLLIDSPGRNWSEIELKAAALARIEVLRKRGAAVYLPRGDQDYAVGVGLRMLLLRRMLVETSPGLYAANPDEQELLAYYAHAIGHWEADRPADPV